MSEKTIAHARALLQNVAEDFAAWNSVAPEKVTELVQSATDLYRQRKAKDSPFLIELYGEIMLQLGAILGPEEAAQRVTESARRGGR